MNFMETVLNKSERTAYELGALYERYGYSQYKMSKFEEYDLYVRNKSFLVSDHIITFTDTDGKLMALKPDVTLSIVKNSKDSTDGVRKVYYNENVYRVPKGALSFKEIMQSGLECIGDIDDYCVSEVLTLAAKSLEKISHDFVLDVSDMSIISRIVDSLSLSRKGREDVLVCIGEKNLHGIDAVCRAEDVDGARAQTLKELVSSELDCGKMLSILKDTECADEARALASIIEVLASELGARIRIDFSVIADMRYYNGIVFKGFVRGVPTAVLSGGRYDSLMQKMGKGSGAIGFAVYLDAIAELDEIYCEYDTDVFVLYDDNIDVRVISKVVREVAQSGERALAGKKVPEKLKYKSIVDLTKEEA